MTIDSASVIVDAAQRANDNTDGAGHLKGEERSAWAEAKSRLGVYLL